MFENKANQKDIPSDLTPLQFKYLNYFSENFFNVKSIKEFENDVDVHLNNWLNQKDKSFIKKKIKSSFNHKRDHDFALNIHEKFKNDFRRVLTYLAEKNNHFGEISLLAFSKEVKAKYFSKIRPFIFKIENGCIHFDSKVDKMSDKCNGASVLINQSLFDFCKNDKSINNILFVILCKNSNILEVSTKNKSILKIQSIIKITLQEILNSIKTDIYPRYLSIKIPSNNPYTKRKSSSLDKPKNKSKSFFSFWRYKTSTITSSNKDRKYKPLNVNEIDELNQSFLKENK